jgi:hypothetical protein
MSVTFCFSTRDPFDRKGDGICWLERNDADECLPRTARRVSLCIGIDGMRATRCDWLSTAGCHCYQTVEEIRGAAGRGMTHSFLKALGEGGCGGGRIADQRSGTLFSYVDSEARVRPDRPLRTIRRTPADQGRGARSAKREFLRALCGPDGSPVDPA